MRASSPGARKTLTLLARDGNRYTLPPRAPGVPSQARLGAGALGVAVGWPCPKAAMAIFQSCREPNVGFGVKVRACCHRPRAPGSICALAPRYPKGRSRGHNGTKQMKTRVIIEYDLPCSSAVGDRVVIRDQEEQRWTKCETVLALPRSATVKVELLDASFAPGSPVRPPRRPAFADRAGGF